MELVCLPTIFLGAAAALRDFLRLTRNLPSAVAAACCRRRFLLGIGEFDGSSQKEGMMVRDDDEEEEEDQKLSAAAAAMRRLGMDVDCGEGDQVAEAAAAVGEILETKEASEWELKEAFYVFDRNEDGFITAEELWNVMRRLGFDEGRRVEDCQRMIRVFDEDGDEKISFLECTFVFRTQSVSLTQKLIEDLQHQSDIADDVLITVGPRPIWKAQEWLLNSRDTLA
ncbi:putative calcium-binding protein CML45 [Apostasia shenzhenica]|uniref:Putative calcium-binding protein CML45 n=1 Tax=Apostasia shenzhenica TaxID=1088818 RepID=A0A2I0AXQ3_9ASPA|nr:putative calcium-binding protein CML45 [Apostasia shenzhenica]